MDVAGEARAHLVGSARPHLGSPNVHLVLPRAKRRKHTLEHSQPLIQCRVVMSPWLLKIQLLFLRRIPTCQIFLLQLIYQKRIQEICRVSGLLMAANVNFLGWSRAYLGLTRPRGYGLHLVRPRGRGIRVTRPRGCGLRRAQPRGRGLHLA